MKFIPNPIPTKITFSVFPWDIIPTSLFSLVKVTFKVKLIATKASFLEFLSICISK